MKKVFSILMAITLLFSLAACSNSTTNEESSSQIQQSSDQSSTPDEKSNSYSDDYDTVVDLAQEEQRNNARPAISGDIENLEQYDVIYIGFPKL